MTGEVSIEKVFYKQNQISEEDSFKDLAYSVIRQAVLDYQSNINHYKRKYLNYKKKGKNSIILNNYFLEYEEMKEAKISAKDFIESGDIKFWLNVVKEDTEKTVDSIYDLFISKLKTVHVKK